MNSTDANVKEFLDSGDIAARLGLSRTRFQQLARAGSLPFVRLGRKFVVPVVTWDRWVAQQSEAALAAVLETTP